MTHDLILHSPDGSALACVAVRWSDGWVLESARALDEWIAEIIVRVFEGDDVFIPVSEGIWWVECRS